MPNIVSWCGNLPYGHSAQDPQSSSTLPHCQVLLRRLHNLISSSVHLSVVWGHVEFLGASWRATVSEGPQVLSSNHYQERDLLYSCGSSWKVTLSEGPQVLSSNSYQEGPLLEGRLWEQQVLVGLKSSICQRGLLLLGGQPCHSPKLVGT